MSEDFNRNDCTIIIMSCIPIVKLVSRKKTLWKYVSAIMKFPCKLRKTTKLCRNVDFFSVAQTFRLEPTSTPTKRVAIYPLFLSSNSHCQVHMAEKVFYFHSSKKKYGQPFLRSVVETNKFIFNLILHINWSPGIQTTNCKTNYCTMVIGQVSLDPFRASEAKKSVFKGPILAAENLS